MRRALLVAVVVLAACSPGDDGTVPESTTSSTTESPITTTSSTEAPVTTTPAPSLEAQAVVVARDAVRAAGVMTVDFADTAIAEVSTRGDVIEVVLLPPNPDTLGATAVVELSAADLTVIEVRHYR